ncbi:hypothetical protein C1645_814531 [Glomus cerebriforme]|uniref:Uncharacterized protein n=1 Tax=Glomus cerebriforme TaxID=658196 RepID=A0A397TKY5_9GLOM|nr:hypothetical protein C1645_814531 [Glomus cerebriforme]
MPILVFEWNEGGFNDVPDAPGLRNGVAGQTKAAIVANLMANGATNYNDIIFAFSSGHAIGEWCRQISMNIQWALNQPGVPNICNSITRINPIIRYEDDDDDDDETGIPSPEFDIENYPAFGYC